ncbi:endonuclease/exonuclease/phosphatase family protein [Aegicerativicinus sediminis]
MCRIHTIAFYNLENFFDTENDPFSNDSDYLPDSDKRWTAKRYERKVYKIGNAISVIGPEQFPFPPTILGVAEIENQRVLDDLLKAKDLLSIPYNYVHYDSYDERGIDTALIYDTRFFEVSSSEIFSVLIEDEDGIRDFTRDILLVSGKLEGEEIHVIVNHWPSKREGDIESEYKRMAAADKLLFVIQKLQLTYSNPKIVVMGDFNDNPDGLPIKHLRKESGFFNALEMHWARGRGSVTHDFKWNVYDQIFISQNLFEKNEGQFYFHGSDIFDPKFLTQYNGRYKGHPFRTYAGKRFLGGFSDHFPVFIQLKRKLQSLVEDSGQD